MKPSRVPVVAMLVGLSVLTWSCFSPAVGDLFAQSGGEGSDSSGGMPDIDWQAAPATASLGDIAEIRIPEGCLFTGAEGTRRFLEANENPTDGDELGLLINTSETGAWFAIFSFSKIGYVKDDEKDQLDADAILGSIREGTAEANKERARRGWSTIEVVGWAVEPKYNTTTNRLEWAVRGRAGEEESINFSTRLLGRRGVMRAQLVSSPDVMSDAIAEFQTALGEFNFTSGNRYAEFRQGDTVAKYGLTALIAGGLGAAAAKSGLLAKLWKFIILAVIGALGFLKRLFNRKSESAGSLPG